MKSINSTILSASLHVQIEIPRPLTETHHYEGNFRARLAESSVSDLVHETGIPARIFAPLHKRLTKTR